MVEATNFVEKTLGKSLNPDENLNKGNTPEATPKIKIPADIIIPIDTPPSQAVQQPVQQQPQTIQIIQQPPQTIQIVEKVTYKKERIHGFFRTLTIIALLVIGFLMLGESTGIIQLSINSFKLHQIFPIIIILSAIIIRSYK
ncbi:TPA: hypothetical protein DCZ39_06400 [Patescibacteria group bacterium]|nr:hypothetical protein [Candidatus Gracilibacteria bacterium]